MISVLILFLTSITLNNGEEKSHIYLFGLFNEFFLATLTDTPQVEKPKLIFNEIFPSLLQAKIIISRSVM